MSVIEKRKADHIDAVLSDPAMDRQGHYFDAISLRHRGLPELDYAQINTTTQLFDHSLTMPFIIGSMSGGADERLVTMNQHLAEAAETVGVALAVGSQRIQLHQSAAKTAFQLRPWAPSIPLIANVGAVQLNYGVSRDDILMMVHTLEANALYLHLNPLQEVIQPEGDTNFLHLADKIHQLVTDLPVPILVKEVGAGLSSPDLKLLLDAGVAGVDVAGKGGTSWSRIEHHRQQQLDGHDDGLLFQDWGIPTPLALQMAQPFHDRLTIIASGGLRSGLDLAKSIIMGAHLGSMAKPFLQPALTSTQAVVDVLHHIQRQLRTTMFCVGVPSIEQLHNRVDLRLDVPTDSE